MKTKSIENTIEEYVISTVIGAYNTKKHWKKRGFDEPSSIDKALNYAYGQINSGIGETFTWEDAEKSFRELSDIANALAVYCKNRFIEKIL